MCIEKKNTHNYILIYYLYVLIVCIRNKKETKKIMKKKNEQSFWSFEHFRQKYGWISVRGKFSFYFREDSVV